MTRVKCRAGEARGRNGWFKPAEIRVHTIDAGYTTAETASGLIEIAVSSNRAADLPPIILRIGPDDAQDLEAALHLEVNHAHT